jgi:hypothetical protein
LFSCQIEENGDIGITSDPHDIPSPYWREYLDDDSERKTKSCTWPRDIEEWNRSEREADLVLTGIEEEHVDEELESLFGSESD